jgi:hypothetical protein
MANQQRSVEQEQILYVKPGGEITDEDLDKVAGGLMASGASHRSKTIICTTFPSQDVDSDAGF